MPKLIGLFVFFLFGEGKKKIQRCQKVFRVFIENITLAVPTVWGCSTVELFCLCDETIEPQLSRLCDSLSLSGVLQARSTGHAHHSLHSTPHRVFCFVSTSLLAKVTYLMLASDGSQNSIKPLGSGWA